MSKRKGLTKQQIDDFCRRIEDEREIIGEANKRLKEIHDELEVLVDSTDEALEMLGDAKTKLLEYA